MQISVIPVTPFQQNCSVIRCEESGRAAVVDPGGDVDRILDFLGKNSITVERILLTHGHLDHAGAAGRLASTLALPIEGPHRGDRFLLESLTAQAERFGLPPASPFAPDRWLEQGDTVGVGAERFEVRHCPGHTPGHVIFYNRQRRFAIVGDVLFDGSIGRTDLPRGDHAELMESIRKNLLTLPEETTFLPGHGPTSTIGEQRRRNPFLRNLEN